MTKSRTRTTTFCALGAVVALAPGVAAAADVVIGVPNWPSVKATANIMKVVLEENLGLEVELQDSTNPVIFEAMDKGSMQVHPEVWLPNQASLFDQYADSVTKNEHSAAAVQGICVNQAAQEAGFSSIADLTDPELAKLLDSDGDDRGEVFIGATGWASTNVEKVKGRSYGYDATVDLKELDEGVAYSQLDAAQTADKPWAGFCYTPHHLFTVHPDLKILEEPAYDEAGWNVLQPDEDPEWLEKSSAAMAWPDATAQPVFANALEEAHPEAATIMRNIDLDEEDLGGFAYALVVDEEDPEAFAKNWVEENIERVGGWLQ